MQWSRKKLPHSLEGGNRRRCVPPKILLWDFPALSSAILTFPGGEAMLHNNASIQTEMAYTTYGESCRDPYLTDGADFPAELRECRRAAKHEGVHASGHGRHYVEWPA